MNERENDAGCRNHPALEAILVKLWDLPPLCGEFLADHGPACECTLCDDVRGLRWAAGTAASGLECMLKPSALLMRHTLARMEREGRGHDDMARLLRRLIAAEEGSPGVRVAPTGATCPLDYPVDAAATALREQPANDPAYERLAVAVWGVIDACEGLLDAHAADGEDCACQHCADARGLLYNARTAEAQICGDLYHCRALEARRRGKAAGSPAAGPSPATDIDVEADRPVYLVRGATR